MSWLSVVIYVIGVFFSVRYWILELWGGIQERRDQDVPNDRWTVQDSFITVAASSLWPVLIMGLAGIWLTFILYTACKWLMFPCGIKTKYEKQKAARQQQERAAQRARELVEIAREERLPSIEDIVAQAKVLAGPEAAEYFRDYEQLVTAGRGKWTVGTSTAPPAIGSRK